MFTENKDYLTRKIIIYIFFTDIFIAFVSAIMMLALVDNQELAYLKNIINTIFIITMSFAMVFFIFCVVEIALNNTVNKKIIQFINNKEFNKGINYLENLPKIKIFYDIYERQFYYIGLLNLYLDNIEKAKGGFYSINISSSIIDVGDFINTTLYLLLIAEESGNTKDKEVIKNYFYNNIVTLKKSKNQYQKKANTINAIEKILNNDLSDMESILKNKSDIPLIKRILANL